MHLLQLRRDIKRDFFSCVEVHFLPWMIFASDATVRRVYAVDISTDFFCVWRYILPRRVFEYVELWYIFDEDSTLCVEVDFAINNLLQLCNCGRHLMRLHFVCVCGGGGLIYPINK